MQCLFVKKMSDYLSYAHAEYYGFLESVPVVTEPLQIVAQFSPDYSHAVILAIPAKKYGVITGEMS